MRARRREQEGGGEEECEEEECEETPACDNLAEPSCRLSMQLGCGMQPEEAQYTAAAGRKPRSRRLSLQGATKARKVARARKEAQFALSCSDEVLYDRLLEANPGGEVHGPWDGNMIRQEVAAHDGNCFIHTALRCSDYDPHEDKDGDVYKAKVSKLREEIHAYLVDHADCLSWKEKCDNRIQRGRNIVEVDSYGKYCEEMQKDGTYMGDLEIQAFCNIRNVAFQVATDKNVAAPSTGLGMMFHPLSFSGPGDNDV